MGIALAIVSMFGLMAHFIATELAARSEIETLKPFVQERAAVLAGALTGKGLQQLNRLLEDQNRGFRPPVILLDEHGRVVASTGLPKRFETAQLSGYFHQLPVDKAGGILRLENEDIIWRLSLVPGTAYRLAILHSDEKDLSFFDALGGKLFIVAFFIVWLSAWGAAVMANVISRRLDEQNAILVHQSLHDQLTDLPNRHLLFDRLQQAVHQASRSNMTVGLFLIELSNLKEINDTLGHQNGDALLRQIGPRLQDALRDTDTVARLDGGEFAVLAPGLGKQDAERLANKIYCTLDSPFNVKDLELKTCAAIGAAIYPDHGKNAQALFRQADVAMGLSIANGNEFYVYTEEADPHSIEQLTLMGELSQAISNNELQLYYQPKIDLKTNTVIGAEALLRWFHPQRGLIPPDDFIPKAEQTAVIKPLTRWVIEHAFQQWAQWKAKGIDIQIAINVSQRNLYDRDLINHIANAMQNLRIDTCTLDIEITETAVMSHPEQSLGILRMLNRMGIHLAIDDFGTGFTSLSYLKELPVDELKIDKSFIINMENDSKDVMIVRSIIELAHSLGRVVVAEGIETLRALELLQNLNCDIAQGYYLSKPKPVQEFEQWLATSPWGLRKNKTHTA